MATIPNASHPNPRLPRTIAVHTHAIIAHDRTPEMGLPQATTNRPAAITPSALSLLSQRCWVVSNSKKRDDTKPTWYPLTAKR